VPVVCDVDVFEVFTGVMEAGMVADAPCVLEPLVALPDVPEAPFEVVDDPVFEVFDPWFVQTLLYVWHL